MIYRITKYEKIDPRKLMDIYRESNLKNTTYFYLDEGFNYIDNESGDRDYGVQLII